ncbi:MAG: hypothetical protein LUF85_06015 [Bacteroides sp.]|nr:hypothetical protein [Bacteroides sp.]
MIEDEGTYTPILIKLIRIWQIRVILYTLVFFIVAIYLYQQLVIHPLEVIKRLGVPENCFIWTTFRQGIIVGYIGSYLPLAVFYFLEFAWCDVYMPDMYYETERIEASKKIRLGILITALLMTCFIPFLIKIAF